MASRRSRKQVHTFTHPKVTGDIPIYLISEPEGIRFEVDLTCAKLAPRIPFCKTGENIAALVAEAQGFIDSYLTLTWTKWIYVAATPILNADAVGLAITTGTLESAEWPCKEGEGRPKLWRTASTPWETRDTPLPLDFKHPTVQVLPWSAEVENAASQLVGKVSSFAQSIISGLNSSKATEEMLLGANAK